MDSWSLGLPLGLLGLLEVVLASWRSSVHKNQENHKESKTSKHQASKTRDCWDSDSCLKCWSESRCGLLPIVRLTVANITLIFAIEKKPWTTTPNLLKTIWMPKTSKDDISLTVPVNGFCSNPSGLLPLGGQEWIQRVQRLRFGT